jgi:hypothetical protein
MKYRLDAQHYIDNMLLEPGLVIGDDELITYRDEKGHPRAPSLQMTPLDDEAKRLFEEHHNSAAPERDPTKSIPLQGTLSDVKVPPATAPRPGKEEPKGIGVKENHDALKPGSPGFSGPKVGEAEPKDVPQPGAPDNRPITPNSGQAIKPAGTK